MSKYVCLFSDEYRGHPGAINSMVAVTETIVITGITILNSTGNSRRDRQTNTDIMLLLSRFIVFVYYQSYLYPPHFILY